eukprot:gene10107-biopygen3469
MVGQEERINRSPQIIRSTFAFLKMFDSLSQSEEQRIRSLRWFPIPIVTTRFGADGSAHFVPAMGLGWRRWCLLRPPPLDPSTTRTYAGIVKVPYPGV